MTDEYEEVDIDSMLCEGMEVIANSLQDFGSWGRRVSGYNCGTVIVLTATIVGDNAENYNGPIFPTFFQSNQGSSCWFGGCSPRTCTQGLPSKIFPGLQQD